MARRAMTTIIGGNGGRYHRWLVTARQHRWPSNGDDGHCRQGERVRTTVGMVVDGDDVIDTSAPLSQTPCQMIGYPGLYPATRSQITTKTSCFGGARQRHHSPLATTRLHRLAGTGDDTINAGIRHDYRDRRAA